MIGLDHRAVYNGSKKPPERFLKTSAPPIIKNIFYLPENPHGAVITIRS
jgi:hypothetical protein